MGQLTSRVFMQFKEYLDCQLCLLVDLHCLAQSLIKINFSSLFENLWAIWKMFYLKLLRFILISWIMYVITLRKLRLMLFLDFFLLKTLKHESKLILFLAENHVLSKFLQMSWLLMHIECKVLIMNQVLSKIKIP